MSFILAFHQFYVYISNGGEQHSGFFIKNSMKTAP